MIKIKLLPLEGLRAIGWIGVFLCHFRAAFFPAFSFCLDHTPLKFIWSGNAYVRLFFVISGLVIAYKYFSKKNYDLILNDVVKRYFRLMPPILIAEIAVFILMSCGLLYNKEVAQLTGSQHFLGTFNSFMPSFKDMITEALFTTYFKGASAYIGPLWTIMFEYLGAILVLASLIILKTSKLRWIYYALFMCIFYNSYYSYFILGMAIADIFVNTKIKVILQKYKKTSIFLILSGYYLFSMADIDSQSFWSLIRFDIGILIFLVNVLCCDIMQKVLGNSMMQKLGEISYAGYIIHWPVIETISCFLYLQWQNLIDFKPLILIIWCISFMIILALSFTMHVFEKNIYKINNRWIERIMKWS